MPTKWTMVDHGKWSSVTMGKRMMETRGPFIQFPRRVNPDMSYGEADRAFRQQWLKSQNLSAADAATTIHDLRSNPDYQKAK